MDPTRFGVSRIFLGGSTARGHAGPGSDIDLYVVFAGSEPQRHELSAWLEGWSLCLGEVALQQTGQPFPGGILNVQWLKQEPDMRQRLELHELALRSPSEA
ncbi:MAG: nucleotidyltransferase domain-containing protein [Holophagales bacterium]|nr:MAG: nucleotidyltransferase domain-containing protein [Holophagales bacterium]